MKYTGVVQRGTGQGTVLGFPTANVPFTGSETGIYAAIVRMQGKEYKAAVYIDEARKLLEAHVLSFTGDLYGMEIEIELTKRIRDSRQFVDEHEARAQIARDVADASAGGNVN